MQECLIRAPVAGEDAFVLKTEEGRTIRIPASRDVDVPEPIRQPSAEYIKLLKGK